MAHVGARDAYLKRAHEERSGAGYNPFETTSRAEADKVVVQAQGTATKAAVVLPKQNLCEYPVQVGRKGTGPFLTSLDASFQRTGLRAPLR